MYSPTILQCCVVTSLVLVAQEVKKRDAEIEKLRGELATLGVAAKAALEQEEKRKSLEKEVKTLRDENKTLTDNFNSERVSVDLYIRYSNSANLRSSIKAYSHATCMYRSISARGLKHVCLNELLTIPVGLVVRIRRSHRRGRGSIPRQGASFLRI